MLVMFTCYPLLRDSPWIINPDYGHISYSYFRWELKMSCLLFFIMELALLNIRRRNEMQPYVMLVWMMITAAEVKGEVFPVPPRRHIGLVEI